MFANGKSLKGRTALVATALAGTLGAGVTVWATASWNFQGQSLAVGVAPEGFSKHVQVNKNADGSVTPWQLQLQVQGETDHASFRVVMGPGGHSGWHSHPGIVIGTVKSGQIDYYDAQCRKHTLNAGRVFTDDDKTHAIVNTGNVDAELYLSFLVKHNAPRRIDEPAPDCAFETPIP